MARALDNVSNADSLAVPIIILGSLAIAFVAGVCQMRHSFMICDNRSPARLLANTSTSTFYERETIVSDMSPRLFQYEKLDDSDSRQSLSSTGRAFTNSKWSLDIQYDSFPSSPRSIRCQASVTTKLPVSGERLLAKQPYPLHVVFIHFGLPVAIVSPKHVPDIWQAEPARRRRSATGATCKPPTSSIYTKTLKSRTVGTVQG